MMEATVQQPLQEVPYAGPICRLCKWPAPDRSRWANMGKIGMWLWGSAEVPLCPVCYQFFSNIVQIRDIVMDEMESRGIYAGIPDGALDDLRQRQQERAQERQRVRTRTREHEPPPMDKSVFSRSA